MDSEILSKIKNLTKTIVEKFEGSTQYFDIETVGFPYLKVESEIEFLEMVLKIKKSKILGVDVEFCSI